MEGRTLCRPPITIEVRKKEAKSQIDPKILNVELQGPLDISFCAKSQRQQATKTSKKKEEATKKAKTSSKEAEKETAKEKETTPKKTPKT